MNFEQMFDRLVMYALIGFLLVFALSAGVGTKDARTILATYSFALMGLYIYRGWKWKRGYDKIEIAGCGAIGLALNLLNLIS